MYILKLIVCCLLSAPLLSNAYARAPASPPSKPAPTPILTPNLQTISLPLPAYYAPYTLEIGNPDAPLVVHKFFSFACPSCLAFHIHHFPTLETRYIKSQKVRWVYVPYVLDLDTLTIFTLLPHIPTSLKHTVFEKLMQTAPKWPSGNNKKAIFDVFKTCGISDDTLNNLYAQHKESTLNAVFKFQNDIFIDGTPTFFINGKELPGIPSLTDFTTYIEQHLKEQKK